MKKIFTLLSVLFICLPLWSQQGGYALTFDGTNDYISFPVSASLNFSGSTVTVEAWIYPTSFATDYWKNTIASTDLDYKGYSLRCGGNGVLSFIANKAPGTSYNIYSNDNVLTLNKWQHVAGVFTGTYMYLYVNGKQVSSMSVSSLVMDASSSGLKIGAWSSSDSFFTGSIDEVRIWNTARTESEIKANMYKELTGSESGLAAYFKMNEGTGTSVNDAGTNSNTGTLTNGPVWRISGCFAGPGKALDFDGSNDYVTIPSDAGLTTSQFTVEFWMKMKATTGTYAGIIDRGRNSSKNWYFLTIQNSLGGMFGIGKGSSNSEIWFGINDTKWHHIAGTYDGTTASLYLDGMLQSTITVSMSTADKAINLGKWTDLSSNYSNVVLDELRIWNNARSGSDIREEMNKTLAGDEEGLLAYYRMDQYDGTTLYDITGNGHNGTLTNMDASTDWVSSDAFNTWLGGQSNAWGTAANWSNGVPSGEQSIGIYNWSSALPNVTTYQTTLSGSPTVENLLISSGATPVFGSNFTVNSTMLASSSLTLNASGLNSAKNLLIESGGAVTLPASGQLTISGKLQTESSATLTLASGASLITSGTITNDGSININRDISDGQWHLVSAPVSGATANTFLGKYLQSWDEPTHAWSEIVDPDTPLDAMTGFLLWGAAKANTTYTFTGTPFTGNQSKSVSFTEYSVDPNANEGANLVGNPYPSAIDWDLLNETYGAVYYYDGSGYVSWNNGGEGSQYIPPMQGFFIITSSNTTLSLTDSHRTHSGATAFYKQATEGDDFVVLETVSPSGYSDKLFVKFDNQASDQFELTRDARKLISSTDGISQIWSLTPDGGRLSIDVRPECNAIPVGFTNTLNG